MECNLREKSVSGLNLIAFGFCGWRWPDSPTSLSMDPFLSPDQLILKQKLIPGLGSWHPYSACRRKNNGDNIVRIPGFCQIHLCGRQPCGG